MKKIFLLVLSVLFFTANYSQAQMIDYKRRNKMFSAKKNVVESQPVLQKATTGASTRNSAQSQTDSSKTLNRVERIYDLNQDGSLEKNEITDFYKDVVSSVDRKGDFAITSDLLKAFDTDNDGKISKYETDKLKEAIN